MKPSCFLLALLAACSLAAAEFSHSLEGVKPWTDRPFLDDAADFHFAIIPDRTGGERPGFFEKALRSLNLLRPELVMSVGDLINWGGAKDAEKQWEEERRLVESLDMKFFHVVGNHDIITGFTGMTPAREQSIRLWKKFNGERTYYSFVYKRCLFICFDAMETHDYFPPRESMSETQYDWVVEECARHPDVRWTFLFTHKPIDWSSDRWLAMEKRLVKRNYTVFCGDLHNHCTATRNGKKYYMIGTAGGGFDCGVLADDLRYGVMDSITWVTVTQQGPVVANLALSGIYGDTLQTSATTKGWIEFPLDQPTHRATGEGEQRFQAEGYDWNFRHAVIMRQGRVYAEGLEKFKPGKHRVVLLGDESASALKKEHGDEAQVFDLGFAGDGVENVIWRVIEGELAGYAPEEVVISVGAHDRGKLSESALAARRQRLAELVRIREPRAKVTLR